MPLAESASVEYLNPSCVLWYCPLKLLTENRLSLDGALLTQSTPLPYNCDVNVFRRRVGVSIICFLLTAIDTLIDSPYRSKAIPRCYAGMAHLLFWRSCYFNESWSSFYLFILFKFIIDLHFVILVVSFLNISRQ